MAWFDWILGDEPAGRRRPKSRSGRETGTAGIVVSKPMCAPCRIAITQTLEPYRVVIHGIDEWQMSAGGIRVAGGNPPGMDGLSPLVSRYAATITVNTAAAEWVEYLLLRSGQFRVHKLRNRRNAEWAGRHAAMPTPWQAQQERAAEPTCKLAEMLKAKGQGRR